MAQNISTVLYSDASTTRYYSDMATSQGSVRVIRITPDGPANKEGLQVGDLLLEIDGVSVYDLPLNQIMRAIRGKVGTSVELVRLFFFGPRSRVPGTGFSCLFHEHYSTTRENEQILYLCRKLQEVSSAVHSAPKKFVSFVNKASRPAE
jgi:hypothetical protein